ncbi:MAG: Gldg family protein, partial [Candidatus Methanofastidiosia archaeon]
MENIFIGAQIDRKIYIPFFEMIVMHVKKFILFGVFIFLIYSTLAREEKTILIDFSHSSNKEQAQKNLSTFLDTLEKNNFEVEMSGVKLESLSLRDYDVLLLWAPSKILEEQEISLILEFVEKGGGLVVSGDWNVSWKRESRNSYNKLVESFGFRFQENAVDDRTNKAGCKCTPIIHVFENLEEESGIKNVVFAKPCSIEIVGDARAIALGDEDTFVTGKEST